MDKQRLIFQVSILLQNMQFVLKEAQTKQTSECLETELHLFGKKTKS